MNLIATPAAAAVGDESHSSSVFLDASILGGDLGAVVGIDGASADYIDGATPGTSDSEDAPLSVEALSLLTLMLPNAPTVGELLDLGVITQSATALPNGASNATTSTANLSLDLIPLLGSTAVLSEAAVNLGAVESQAIMNDALELSRTTTIADATLDIQSPLIGQTVTTITDAVDALVGDINALQSVLVDGLLGGVNDVLELVDLILGGSNQPSIVVEIDASAAGTALKNLLDDTLSTDLVSIDLSTGTITVNLEGGIDLNNIPANSTLLSPAVMQSVAADVAALLGQLQTNLNNVMTTILGAVSVLIDVDLTIPGVIPGIPLAGLTIDFDGSLDQLLNGASPLDIQGSGLLFAIEVLGVPAILNAVAPTILNPLITTILSTAGTAISGAVTSLTNALSPVLTALGGLAQVNLNVQNDSDGVASEAAVTAVQALLLPGANVLAVNLATSAVGPNVNGPDAETTIEATDTEPGASTDVTGASWPANTAVTLQVTDPAGADVGAPISVTTDADGAIPAGTTYPIPADADNGEYQITGTSTGGVTATDTFQVATPVPALAPPVIETVDGTAVTDGPVLTNDPQPEIAGTGVPGATVVVSDAENNELGETVVGDDGTWSLTPADALPQGDTIVSAVQTGEPGSTSDPSDPVTITVDTVAPDAPVITDPTNGDVVGDQPQIAGTGEPGATVDVELTNPDATTTVFENIPVDEDGFWSVTPDEPLEDGDYTVVATQTDEAGNTSGPSTPVDFTVDATLPDIAITAPVDGSVINDSTPDVTGTGEVGATITLTVDGDPVTAAEPVVVGDDGTWVFPLTDALEDGEHTVVATATDAGGNTADDSSTFTLDSLAPAAPVITTVDGEDASGGSVATNNSQPVIAGTGEAGATVVVSDADDNEIGEAVVAEDGTWAVTPSSPLDEGETVVSAVQTDAAGNVSDPSNEVAITIDTEAPAVPVITTVDGKDASGGSVATNNPSAIIAGTGEVGATIVVSDADDNQIGEAVVAEDGTWAVTPTSPLDEGETVVSAVQTDAAGNVSGPSNEVAITIDTEAPTVAITAPEDGSSINNSTPDVTGIGEAGATITLNIDGAPVTSDEPVIVAADGTWVFPLTDPLEDGEHTVVATATDAAGNIAEDLVTFTVDTEVPSAPVIETVDGEDASGGEVVTNNPQPEITGTGEPGATVVVSDAEGNEIGEAVVGEDGTWSLTPAEALPEGDTVITAVQTDDAGNVSEPSDPVTITVDTEVPAAPVIDTVDGQDVGDGPVVTNNSQPEITGTGEPGATVVVSDAEGNELGEAVVGEDGTWSLTPAEALPEGDTVITAVQTDPAGNVSEPSDPVTITVDTEAPAAPVITTVDGKDASGGSVATNNPSAIIAGTGEAGATIVVSDADDNQIGQAVVAEDGTWAVTPTSPLDEGETVVSAVQTDAAGNVSDPSNEVAITIDTEAPAAPVITTVDGEDASGGDVATNNPQPDIAGTGEAGATVVVSDADGNEIGEAVVTDEGTWTVTPSSPLAEGETVVSAVQTDAAGNVSDPSNEVAITIDTEAPAAPVITTVDGEDASGGDVVTNNPQPEITGTGEPGATVVVSDAEGNEIGEAVVAEDGTWTLTPAEALPEGDTVITAVQTDPAGNVSEPSDPVTITVDTYVAPPVITSPEDGSTVTDPQPPIEGTGDPGSTIIVEINDVPVGTVEVGEDGTWSLTPESPLPAGENTITAFQQDPIGNVSEGTSVTFTIADPSDGPGDDEDSGDGDSGDGDNGAGDDNGAAGGGKKGGGGLAKTGQDLGILAVLSLVLLGGGALLVRRTSTKA